MKVLIAEDDRFTREGLTEVLEGKGFQAVAAIDLAEAVRLFQQECPDFVCLDIMMPGRSGYEVCRAIRVQSADVPINFISAKAEEFDRLVGFELGADDFIVKPFRVREVISRVRAVARRCCARQPVLPVEFEMRNLRIIPAELRAKRDQDVIELSPRDVRILQLLHDHAGQALDRNTIFRVGWGEDYFPNSRTLDQHISQLRKRIEPDPRHPTLIQTVPGVGYRFDNSTSDKAD
jgi:two-component system alkaline phosphatase synthesis response regulator PhoP